MKKRKIDELLTKMSSHSIFGKDGRAGITDLQDELAATIFGGVKPPTNNTSCSGSNNFFCNNSFCWDSFNSFCSNSFCITQD